METPSRRAFLGQLGAAGAIGLESRTGLAGEADTSPQESAAQAKPPARRKGMVGIQIGAVSFVDEGVDKALDTLQERAGVNAIMISVFTYSYGSEGRQQPGAFSDHGLQTSNVDTFHGGNYAAIHPEYYKDNVFGNFRAPDLGDFDVFEAVIPKAKARGIKTFAWCEDQAKPQYVTQFEKGAEVDVDGKSTGQMCLNNPYVHSFFASMEEDWIKSHPIDGVMFGSERQGPFGNAIGAKHGRMGGSAPLTCFCTYCAKKGRDRGIDVDRAREGYKLLRQWVAGARAGSRPTDGYFVTFWRLLLKYPEILAWEQMWSDNQQELYSLIYGTAKNINHNLQVGFHVWHNNSFSPFYRAEQDYWALRQSADFLKPVVYNNCAGPRMVEYIHNVQSTVFRDNPPEEVLDWHYDVLGYKGEASLRQLPAAGLSSKYVAEETARAVAGVKNEIPICPGIDINVPTAKGEKTTEPADVRAAVEGALIAGASGVILSRKYYEMTLANLSAAGEVFRSAGLA